MAGFKLCIEGERIYALQKLVSKLRHLGCRAHAYRMEGATASLALAKSEMVKVCREIEDMACQMRGALQ